MAFIYFKSQVRRLREHAYDEGFVDGVKFQKYRSSKVSHVD